jgi:hypothetical protein
MQSPFWENLLRTFQQLKGRSLLAAAFIWLFVLGLGLFCASGGFSWAAQLGTPDDSEPVAESGQSPTQTSPSTAGGETGGATDGVGGGGEIQPTATLPQDTITLPTPTPVPADATPVSDLPPLEWGDFGYGIAVQGVIPVAGDYTYSMRQVTDHLGFGWVKQQLRWDDVYHDEDGEPNWGLYDPVVDAADELGLKLLLSVVDAPPWTRDYIGDDPLAAPPADLSLYADFVGELVDRYDGKVHAIEIWNEQNLKREWNTTEGLNPERYVEMLRLAYQAIKSRNPDILVISGALSPASNFPDPDTPNRYLAKDDFEYLQGMIAAGALDYADCVGAHHNGINMPPDVAWDEGYDDPTASFRGPFDNPHHSWSFKSTLWNYHTMVQEAGYNKPLCLTEFGWASAEGWPEVAQGFEFAWDNTLAEQAEWDVEAFHLMRQWGFVHLAFLWNLDYWQKGGIGMTDPNAPYSIIDDKGIARPAFDALREMPKTP